jgi:hypothetical protein
MLIISRFLIYEGLTKHEYLNCSQNSKTLFKFYNSFHFGSQHTDFVQHS